MSICKVLVEKINDNLTEILTLRNDKEMKPDGSFVSKGDLLVQEIVFKESKRLSPLHVLISEELAPFDNVTWDSNGSYIILDPIDGTENFVSGLKEWGVGISVYTNGEHIESCIYLPELRDVAITGTRQPRYSSRIHGLSSSLTREDLKDLTSGYEYRIIGCSMYNMLSAVRGSYARFENVRGVNCWDVLPGLNLALENGVKAFVDGEQYRGQLLFPTKKYKILLECV